MKPKKILVVEDDSAISEIMKEILELEGYEVQCASNGKKAIDYLSTCTKRPNLILLDIMMPEMDGFQFREAQMKDQKNFDIPVVVMSADGQGHDKKNRLHADHYLKKPLELDLVLSTICRYIK